MQPALRSRHNRAVTQSAAQVARRRTSRPRPDSPPVDPVLSAKRRAAGRLGALASGGKVIITAPDLDDPRLRAGAVKYLRRQSGQIPGQCRAGTGPLAYCRSRAPAVSRIDSVSSIFRSPHRLALFRNCIPARVASSWPHRPQLINVRSATDFYSTAGAAFRATKTLSRVFVGA